MANRISVKLGVLGAGNHSIQHHGPGLKILAERYPDRVQLVSVCDLNEEKAIAYAKLFGFKKTYTNIKTMLNNEQLDGLVAITPLPLTLNLIKRLLPYGIAMMIEKPPGQSLKQTEQLASLAAKFGTPHIISFDRRFSPAIYQAREWLKNYPDTPPYALMAVMRRIQRTESDFLIGTGIHLIDTIIALMGTPKNYVIQNNKHSKKYYPIFRAIIDFEQLRSGVLEITPDAGNIEETYTLTGAGYTMVIDTFHCCTRVIEYGNQIFSWAPPSTMTSAEKDGAVNEAEAFINLIETGTEVHPTLSDTIETMRIAEKIQQKASLNN